VPQLKIPTPISPSSDFCPRFAMTSFINLEGFFPNTVSGEGQWPMSTVNPSYLSGQSTFQVHGDTSMVTVPSPLGFSMPSQNEVAQHNEHVPPKRAVCHNCGKRFNRKQERDRHIRSYLPHSIYCPFPRCPWRGDRQVNLTKHWKENHPNYGPAPRQQQSRIYNPDSFVEQVVCGELTVEFAAEIALLRVESRTWELDKGGVWADGWGRRKKKFRQWATPEAGTPLSFTDLFDLPPVPTDSP